MYKNLNLKLLEESEDTN